MEESPEQRKSCYDCKFLYSRVNWWCGNKEAIQYRGTRIPGVTHCPYWQIEPSMKPKPKKMKFYRCFTNVRQWCEGTYVILELKLCCARNWPTPLPRTYVINLRWHKFRLFSKLYESEKKFTKKEISLCLVKGTVFLFLQWAMFLPFFGTLWLIAILSSIIASLFEGLSDFILTHLMIKHS